MIFRVRGGRPRPLDEQATKSRRFFNEGPSTSVRFSTVTLKRRSLPHKQAELTGIEPAHIASTVRPPAVGVQFQAHQPRFELGPVALTERRSTIELLVNRLIRQKGRCIAVYYTGLSRNPYIRLAGATT